MDSINQRLSAFPRRSTRHVLRLVEPLSLNLRVRRVFLSHAVGEPVQVRWPKREVIFVPSAPY